MVARPNDPNVVIHNNRIIANARPRTTDTASLTIPIAVQSTVKQQWD